MHFFKGYVGIDLMIKMCDTVTEEMDWRKIWPKQTRFRVVHKWVVSGKGSKQYYDDVNYYKEKVCYVI